MWFKRGTKELVILQGRFYRIAAIKMLILETKCQLCYLLEGNEKIIMERYADARENGNPFPKSEMPRQYQIHNIFYTKAHSMLLFEDYR